MGARRVAGGANVTVGARHKGGRRARRGRISSAATSGSVVRGGVAATELAAKAAEERQNAYSTASPEVPPEGVTLAPGLEWGGADSRVGRGGHHSRHLPCDVQYVRTVHTSDSNDGNILTTVWRSSVAGGTDCFRAAAPAAPAHLVRPSS